jgi:hypothetical protein
MVLTQQACYSVMHTHIYARNFRHFLKNQACTNSKQLNFVQWFPSMELYVTCLAPGILSWHRDI